MPSLLRERQIEAILALDWLLDDSKDSIATGRTVTVAIALLRKALRHPGRRVYLFDHHEGVGEARRVLDLIMELAETEPTLFDLHFVPTTTHITYQGDPILDWWPERMYSNKLPMEARRTSWERLGRDE